MNNGADNWFEYDWQVEGIPALFSVDLSLAELGKSSVYPLMIYISCMTPEGKPFTRMELVHLNGLLKKFKKLLPIFAGSIETEDQHQLYFYAEDDSAFSEIRALCKTQKGAGCRAGCMAEPDWRTYYKLLYPDAAKTQTEHNRKNIELCRSKGDCITAARRINLDVYFPTEALMMSFSEQARQSGFAISRGDFAQESELPHGVVLHIICSLEKRRIDRLTTRVIRDAAKFGGQLVYWNCQIVRKKPPLV